jgi:hypothetical protein
MSVSRFWVEQALMPVDNCSVAIEIGLELFPNGCIHFWVEQALMPVDNCSVAIEIGLELFPDGCIHFWVEQALMPAVMVPDRFWLQPLRGHTNSGTALARKKFGFAEKKEHTDTRMLPGCNTQYRYEGRRASARVLAVSPCRRYAVASLALTG